jgi:glycosyltransferase involved in cell wall biosynthesis
VAAVRNDGQTDVSLVVVGQRQWGAADLDRQVARLGRESWVVTPGFVSDEALLALVNRAAVVAYPSLYEGFGLPVLEALACGAVVVAGNRTAVPEVAGDAALLVDPTSDDDLAAAILRALTDESLRRDLGIAGPARAAAFTWDRCADRTVEVYRRVGAG